MKQIGPTFFDSAAQIKYLSCFSCYQSSCTPPARENFAYFLYLGEREIFSPSQLRSPFKPLNKPIFTKKFSRKFSSTFKNRVDVAAGRVYSRKKKNYFSELSFFFLLSFRTDPFLYSYIYTIQ